MYITCTTYIMCTHVLGACVLIIKNDENMFVGITHTHTQIQMIQHTQNYALGQPKPFKGCHVLVREPSKPENIENELLRSLPPVAVDEGGSDGLLVVVSVSRGWVRESACLRGTVVRQQLL